MPKAFINYRRSDAAQAAQGLYAQLRARFGPTSAFLDTTAILPGAAWPDRLTEELGGADVLLAVIGPQWLAAADDYGRRRLDDEGDWVRNEIAFALEHETPVVPVLVAGMASPPPEEGLPACIRGLVRHQACELRDAQWDQDLTAFIRHLESEFGFVDNQTDVPLPQPEVDLPALTAAELDGALAGLPGWKPIESMVPKQYPRSRHELRKTYRFKSFRAAVQFMLDAVPTINRLEHHPRWENQWRSVTVYLTTWDIGNRISKIDVDLAKELDALYAAR